LQKEVGQILQKSSIYKTAPWGNTNQGAFLNQVLKVQTTLAPLALLNTIFSIEKTMGRIRQQKWEARIIDIDILFYAQEIIEEQGLNIPHPLLHQRRFTLVPLAEVASNFVHPMLKTTINKLLEQCEDNSLVEKL
jgi:2-amino-4-hydroxy-6-hydroxymethyldihydropteridine diphosphokinase